MIPFEGWNPLAVWFWRAFGKRLSLRKLLLVVTIPTAMMVMLQLTKNENVGPITEIKTNPKMTKQFTMSIKNKSLKSRKLFKEVPGAHLTYPKLWPIGARFELRKRLIQEQCQGHRSQLLGLSYTKWAFERIEIDSHRHYLYCPILKVGSTFWRRIFYVVRDGKTVNTPYDVSIQKALRAKRELFAKMLPLNRSSTQHYINNSLNIMFVREPYSRLMSGYIDKLFAPNPFFWKAIGKYIVRTYRKQPSKKSLQCGHDVTFAEFVKYVIDTEARNDSHRDAHFTPMYDQCKPCEIEYNLIGKMETFGGDTEFILNALGENVSENALKQWAVEAEEDAILDSTNSPFGWRSSIKRCMSFYEAAKRIWHKMQIRGIVGKDFEMPFSEKIVNKMSSRDFVNALNRARDARKGRELVKQQKRQALKQAFKTVPSEDLQKYKQLFNSDFKLFAYDPEPDFIFGKDDESENWVFNL